MPDGIGHNKPPEDALRDKLEGILANAEGAIVTNDETMALVDGLLAGVKDVEKDAKAAKEVEFRPAKKVCDDIASRFKPILDDCAKAKKDLAAILSDYKVKRAAEIAAEKARLEEEAAEKARLAQIAEDAADMTDKESRILADQMNQESRVARKAVSDVGQVKGLRTYKFAKVSDAPAFWSWLQQNSLALELLQDAAESLHRQGYNDMSGVTIVEEKRAV